MSSFYPDLTVLILDYLGHFFLPFGPRNHLAIKSNLFWLRHILYIFLLLSIPTGNHTSFVGTIAIVFFLSLTVSELFIL